MKINIIPTPIIKALFALFALIVGYPIVASRYLLKASPKPCLSSNSQQLRLPLNNAIKIGFIAGEESMMPSKISYKFDLYQHSKT